MQFPIKVKSGLSPPAFPPQSVKIQSFTHASKLYAISYKVKKLICSFIVPILFGARAFTPLFHTFSTVIPSLSTVLSTKLSTLSDVSFKIRSAQAGYNVHISVEIPRIWVSFGIADFIRLCTSPHELSTVIHRNLHRFSTVFVLKNGWTYKKRLSPEKERAAFLRAFQAERRIYFDLS